MDIYSYHGGKDIKKRGFAPLKLSIYYLRVKGNVNSVALIIHTLPEVAQYL